MQGKKNSLKATRVSKGGKKKNQTQQNKTTNHKKTKKSPTTSQATKALKKLQTVSQE